MFGVDGVGYGADALKLWEKRHQGGVLVFLSWAAGWERARPGLHSAAGCVGSGMCGDSGGPGLSARSTGCRARQSRTLWTSCRSCSASHPHSHCYNTKVTFSCAVSKDDSNLQIITWLTQLSRQRSPSESGCPWSRRSRPFVLSAAPPPPSVSYSRRTSSSPPGGYRLQGCTGWSILQKRKNFYWELVFMGLYSVHIRNVSAAPSGWVLLLQPSCILNLWWQMWCW